MATKLCRNEGKNCSKVTDSTYSQEIKEFSTLLHFYSPRVYRFVRKSLHLPYPASTRSWLMNIECEPGFLKKALEFVEEKFMKARRMESQLKNNCNGTKSNPHLLEMWTMALSKLKVVTEVPLMLSFIWCVGYKTMGMQWGYTMVFVTCGLQKPWYIPITYLLMNNVNGDNLKQSICEAINLLTEKGAEVSASIFDGSSKNSSTAEKLGRNIKKLETVCPHQSTPNQKVYVILDVCHMLKLARNTFADIKIFCTPSGKRISWEYVLALHITQQKDVVNLGNKLTSKHVQWQNHNMKVSVAAQTISQSVSSAITFLTIFNYQS